MAAEPVNRAGRTKCYKSRDAYFDCLERTIENHEKCAEFRKDFNENCKSSWIEHFEKRRKFLKFRDDVYANKVHPVTGEALPPLSESKQKQQEK